jgi:hypothetical protein
VLKAHKWIQLDHKWRTAVARNERRSAMVLLTSGLKLAFEGRVDAF